MASQHWPHRAIALARCRKDIERLDDVLVGEVGRTVDGDRLSDGFTADSPA
jgi:hypothetical protein